MIIKILCIVPVYNEELRLPLLIARIKQSKKKIKNINFLFINNGSNDRSLSILKKNRLNFINLKKNMGVGYALILGLKVAIKNNYKILVHLAGNGKMLPSEIPIFLKQIINNKIDFVSGSRFLKNGGYKSNPLIRIFLIRILSFFISKIYNKKITDATCGFRAFKTKIFKKKLNFFDRKKFYTYGYEYYSIGKVIRSKTIKFLEIPVTMQYPKNGPYSKMTPIIDWAIMINAWLLAIIDQKRID
jgi:glycosyltransferase involved in cell wall biosynthesis